MHVCVRARRACVRVQHEALVGTHERRREFTVGHDSKQRKAFLSSSLSCAYVMRIRSDRKLCSRIRVASLGDEEEEKSLYQHRTGEREREPLQGLFPLSLSPSLSL